MGRLYVHTMILRSNTFFGTQRVFFHQINVAAFSARYDIPMGAQGLPESAPWVGQVSREELQKEFDAWGPDVRTLLGCLPEKTLRWSVHVVHPSLESYSKGNVALLGDAVRVTWCFLTISGEVLRGGGFDI